MGSTEVRPGTSAPFPTSHRSSPVGRGRRLAAVATPDGKACLVGIDGARVRPCVMRRMTDLPRVRTKAAGGLNVVGTPPTGRSADPRPSSRGRGFRSGRLGLVAGRPTAGHQSPSATAANAGRTSTCPRGRQVQSPRAQAGGGVSTVLPPRSAQSWQRPNGLPPRPPSRRGERARRAHDQRLRSGGKRRASSRWRTSPTRRQLSSRSAVELVPWMRRPRDRPAPVSCTSRGRGRRPADRGPPSKAPISPGSSPGRRRRLVLATPTGRHRYKGAVDAGTGDRRLQTERTGPAARRPGRRREGRPAARAGTMPAAPGVRSRQAAATPPAHLRRSGGAAAISFRRRKRSPPHRTGGVVLFPLLPQPDAAQFTAVATTPGTSAPNRDRGRTAAGSGCRLPAAGGRAAEDCFSSRQRTDAHLLAAPTVHDRELRCSAARAAGAFAARARRPPTRGRPAGRGAWRGVREPSPAATPRAPGPDRHARPSSTAATRAADGRDVRGSWSEAARRDARRSLDRTARGRANERGRVRTASNRSARRPRRWPPSNPACPRPAAGADEWTQAVSVERRGSLSAPTSGHRPVLVWIPTRERELPPWPSVPPARGVVCAPTWALSVHGDPADSTGACA